MERKNSFSIIVITKDNTKNCIKTIQNIDEQTYSDIEIVIVCGDNQNEKLENHKSRINKIKFLTIGKDTGIYDAMNIGISNSKNEWVMFLNAGDFLYSKEVIEQVNAKITSEQNGVLYGDCIYKDPITGKKKKINAWGLNEIDKGKMPFNHQSCFINRRILDKIKYNTSLKLSGDYDLILRIKQKCYKFYYINLSIAVYKTYGFSFKENIAATVECLVSLKENNYKAFENIDLNERFSSFSFERRKWEMAARINLIFKPLEKVINKNDKILIYGYSVLGKIIRKIIENNKFIGFVDKHKERNERKRIFPIDDILKLDFDIIILSCIGHETEVLNDLYFVDKNKIYILEA